MLPFLSYCTIVLEPPAPVESAPLPYSTKTVPFAAVMESGAFAPTGAPDAKVFIPLITTISILHGCSLRRGKEHLTDDTHVTICRANFFASMRNLLRVANRSCCSSV